MSVLYVFAVLRRVNLTARHLNEDKWRLLITTLFVSLPVVLASASFAAPSLKATIVGSFSAPVYVTRAPDSSRILFVVERPGVVRVLLDEVKRTEPFLDIRDIVRGPPDAGAGNEEGLLSIAFPPNYAQTRRFYVAFTNNAGNVEIDEFRRAAGNALKANRATRRPVIQVLHPDAKNHNGGQLQFGPDGLLYISIGDGGRTPRGDLARNINSLLGKILRINPLPSGSNRYTIPASNPFVGKTGRDEVFAYGLRNPWRFAFDGQRIMIGDVGERRREEVDFLTIAAAKGANFGWPAFEGELSFDPTRPGPGPAKPPMHTYSHDQGCAIVGGYVMHGARIPALANRYLYSDACSGAVRSFVPNVANQTAGDDKTTGLSLPGISSFGLGANGRIYATQLGSGRLLRLDPR